MLHDINSSYEILLEYMEFGFIISSAVSAAYPLQHVDAFHGPSMLA